MTDQGTPIEENATLVSFYLQAGARIGLGHLARSAALITQLSRLGKRARVHLDADALGWAEAGAHGLAPRTDLASGGGPLVIDAVQIPDDKVVWMQGFSTRILISPVCDRVDLATHVMVRDAPEKLRAALVSNQALLTDPDFAFVTSNGLSSRTLTYDELRIGLCLSGGDDPTDLDKVVRVLAGAPHVREIWVLDRRSPSLLPQGGPTVSQSPPVRSPWQFLAPINVFVGGEGVMLAEAMAQGIPTISLAGSGHAFKNKALVETGSLALVSRDPFDAEGLKSVLSDRNSLAKMHEAALRLDGATRSSRLAHAIAEIVDTRESPQ